MQFLHTLYLQQIGTHTNYLGPHPAQHPAKLQHVRLTSCIENGGNAFCQNRRHNDIGRSGNGSFIKQHVSTLQMTALHMKSMFIRPIRNGGTQGFKTRKMRVQTAAANLIAARLRNHCMTDTRQKRPGCHYRTAQSTRFLPEIFRMKIIGIDMFRLKTESMFFGMFHLNAHRLQKFDKLDYIADKRNIVQRYLVARKQTGTDYLQSLILGSLRSQASVKTTSACNGERTQNGLLFLKRAPLGIKPLLSRLVE